MGADQGIEWAQYSAETQAVLSSLLPGYGSKILNPSDLTSLATGEPAMFSRALDAIVADPNIDAVAPIFAFVTRAQIETGVEFVRNCTKPAAMIWVGACTDDTQPTAEELVAAGVPVYRDALPCLRAIRAAADFGQRVAAHTQGTDVPRRPTNISIQAARDKLGTQVGTLTEREAKLVLAEYGFPITREQLARTAEEAVSIAYEIAGSVALKIDSADIPHKTDAGAVKLGLQGDDAVRRGYVEVMAAAARHAPDARINGVLVQEMVPQGVEMMLGIIRDPVFGPVIAAGLGGIHIEVLRDVNYRVAPVTPENARLMVDELRVRKLLDGVRGMPPRDVESLCDLIVRLSWFAHDFRNEIAEIDINPLVVMARGAGCRVVDALIVRSKK
jgi:acetyltransferase